MNCYFCQRARQAQPAVAICHSCGAACCLAHLEERTHAGRGPGLQPILAPRVEMLCVRCMDLQGSLLPITRRKAAKSVAAAALLVSAPPALPNAKEAISTVEDMLALQRAATTPRKGWRRFFQRKPAIGD